MNWFICCCILTLVLRNDNVVSAFIFGSPHSSVSCDHLPEYNNLIKTLKLHPCISDTQIWQMLIPLHDKSHSCLRQLITIAAGYVESHNIDGTGCHCSHKFDREHVHSIGHNHDNYWTCVVHNSNCEYLFHYFYLRTSQTHAKSQCQSNSHVWTHLRDIRGHLGVDVQTDIILHLAQTFSKGHENVCTCTKVSTLKAEPSSTVTVSLTTKPTTQENTFASATSPFVPSATQPASGTSKHNTEHFNNHQITSSFGGSTATSSHAIQNPQPVPSNIDQSSTNALNITTNCEKYRSISGIAASVSVSHPLAYLCLSGNRTSNEAYVLVNCQVGIPENWKEGPNVMANCASIPTYTPIATFKTEYAGVRDHEGLSGIFLGCTYGGFKIAFQNCDTYATIKHIESASGSGIDDPYNYFVIA
ncbi:uncharacterized protein LOC132756286 isoform X2 [Ruditapes philippinarum]|uniref:uncharacterized protein LOC132756286 isoform X2 n=1 Tax=Ruditapes philippinarum TaxID=129788 RepID=UPI00295A6BCB|nr:uncharacterized protein LOC132756286 isoform X2 [Ruditapes philippinarum]